MLRARQEKQTIWAEVAPEAVFTVRTYAPTAQEETSEDGTGSAEIAM